MVPRPNGRGNQPIEAVWNWASEASMVPRPNGRGNTTERTWSRCPLCDASMVPRPNGRGNHFQPVFRDPVEELQWCHVLTDVETHPPRVRHSDTSACFNGATS